MPRNKIVIGNTSDNASIGGSFTAGSLIKSGGTSSQFLKADGSVDSNTYLTSYTETDTLQSVTNRGSSTSNSITCTGTLFMKDSGPSIHENRINAGWNSTGDTIDLWINYEGYQNSNGYFRDFRVGDGKRGNAILFIDGSTRYAQFSNNVGIGQSLTIDAGALYVSNGSGTAYSTQLSTNYSYPLINSYLDSYAGSQYSGRLHFRTNSDGGGMVTQYTITHAGQHFKYGRDNSGDRTNPFNTLIIETDNNSNPYNGFGGCILFKNRIYVGGPTPGGIRDGARIRTAIQNNSSVNNGTDLIFENTATGDGALQTRFTLSYSGQATFSGGILTQGDSSRLGGDDFSYFQSIGGGLGGSDYQHKYLLIMRVPTFGNVSVNCGIRGKLTMERVNGIGIDLHDEVDLTTFYGNQTVWNHKSWNSDYNTNLVVYNYNGTNYLALYVFSAPNYHKWNFTGVLTNYGGWFDSNLFRMIEVSSSNHTAASYSTKTTIFKQSVTSYGDVTAYSDIKFKTDVKTIDNALNKVMALRGVNYKRVDVDTDKVKVGVIAQEVEDVLPEVVETNGQGIKSVAYGNIVGLLIEGMKEQQKQIEELKNLVNAIAK